ncbi:MAG: hypothetical protein QXQ43_06625, partial [Nitrososphaerota archaeon]
PSIEMIAKAYGAYSAVATNREEVGEFIKNALKNGGVNVLDAHITTTEKVLPDFLTTTYKK